MPDVTDAEQMESIRMEKNGEKYKFAIICGIRLLTPNSLGGTCRRICLLDIRSASSLEVFT